MNERLEEDDRTALAGISNSPPHRKAQYYGQQLRTNTGTHHKRQHQLRKHSLDENRIMNHHPVSKNSVYFGSTPNSSDDEEFYPYSTTTSAAGSTGSMSDRHVDYQQFSQRIDGTSGGDGYSVDESQRLPQQPMPEFMGSGGGWEYLRCRIGRP
ncbi:UNVERIFIED_CONTAM: Type I inositol polyphosphate 5-phosphatase 12 [Sesamum angustifolium]|uniref:Type I inositol polyphosphate 5-phosphatase 12 n=1 Tax=Sesamum angustifolium TaxID=2727405 RepID=A0AAW2LX26_9LAMI